MKKKLLITTLTLTSLLLLGGCGQSNTVEMFFATPNYPKMQNAFPKVAAGNSSFLHVPPA